MAHSYTEFFDTATPQRLILLGGTGRGKFYISSTDNDITSDGVSVDASFSRDGNVSPGYCGSKNMSLTIYNKNGVWDGGEVSADLTTATELYVGVYVESDTWRSRSANPVASGVTENCWMKRGTSEYIGTSNGLYINGTRSSWGGYETSEVKSFVYEHTEGETEDIYMIDADGEVWKIDEEDATTNVTNIPTAMATKLGDTSTSLEIMRPYSEDDPLVTRSYGSTDYDEYSYDLVGLFYLDTFTKDTQRETLTLDYFDAMTKFDKSARGIEDSLSSSFSGNTLFTALCTAAGVSPTVDSDIRDELADITLEKEYVFATNGLTLRDYYMYLAERIGAVGYINLMGQADMKHIETDTSTERRTYPQSAISSGGRTITDSQVSMPTKVVAYTTAGTTEEAGSGDNVYESTSNVLLYNDTDGLAFCQTLLTSFSSISAYYPQTVELLETPPFLFPFARVTLTGLTNATFPVTSFSYRWNGRGKGQIVAGGDPVREPSSTESVDSQAATASATQLNAAKYIKDPTNFATDYTQIEGGYYELGQFVIVDCKIFVESGMSATVRNVCKFPVPASAGVAINACFIGDDGLLSTPLYALINSSGYLRIKNTTAVSGDQYFSVSGIYKKV